MSAGPNINYAAWAIGLAICFGGALLVKRQVDKTEVAKADESLEEQRAAICPDLKTWNECADRLRSKGQVERQGQQETADLRSNSARNTVLGIWRDYDGLPKKTSDALMTASSTAITKANSLPEPEAAELKYEIIVSTRERMAPIIRPEARATGAKREVLVPSANQAQCRVWGSMWANDEGTADSMRQIGFERIVCADKSWDLY